MGNYSMREFLASSSSSSGFAADDYVIFSESSYWLWITLSVPHWASNFFCKAPLLGVIIRGEIIQISKDLVDW